MAEQNEPEELLTPEEKTIDILRDKLGRTRGLLRARDKLIPKLGKRIATLETEREQRTHERDEALAALYRAREGLRYPMMTLGDLPPDTILGESGMQAIEELKDARAIIEGGCDHEAAKPAAERAAARAEFGRRWVLKAMAEKMKAAALESVNADLVGALEKIRAVTGTSTEANHIARAALKRAK